MHFVMQCGGYEVFKYNEREVPEGFLEPCYRVTAPDGVERNVSEDKMKDALDYAFELSA